MFSFSRRASLRSGRIDHWICERAEFPAVDSPDPAALPVATLLEMIEYAIQRRPVKRMALEHLRRQVDVLDRPSNHTMHELLSAVDTIRAAIETGELGSVQERKVRARAALTGLIDRHRVPALWEGPRRPMSP